MSDFRQQQEQDELQFYLWSSLEALRGHISAETFQAAEQQLGLTKRENEREHNRISIH